VLRLAEVVFALSLASDLGMGQPLEHGLRTTMVALRLAELAGLGRDELGEVYYVALLHYVGCSAEAQVDADFLGDEIAARPDLVGTLFGSRVEMARVGLRHLHPELPAHRRALVTVRSAPVMLGEFRRWAQAHCEVAQLIGDRLELGEGVRASMGMLSERWDGKGFPGASGGDQLPLAVRFMQVAHDAEIWWRRDGVEGAREQVGKRGGHGLDPDIARLLGEHAETVLAGLDAPSLWDQLLAAEPGRCAVIASEQRFEDCLTVIADFADMKTSQTVGHSRSVAALAANAAAAVGMGEEEVMRVRHAALVHDVGRVAISAGIWTKAGELSRDEKEQIRLAPYYTERILDRPERLRELGHIAGMHQERCDGSGYHRGLQGTQIPVPARILAVADAYCTLSEVGHAREALPPQQAAATITDEVEAGRLDPDAANAVLAAAGLPAAARTPAHPAGLTDREAQVLSLLARGHATKQIAWELGISPKTADHHIQNLYAKIGISTRAGATLFALQHNLLPSGDSYSPTSQPQVGKSANTPT
jgi:HD-GYP domain-containing protein (c-di-GMP phosphodiesterase class II)/DNA-binding CsgD family transcriptional regulator